MTKKITILTLLLLLINVSFAKTIYLMDKNENTFSTQQFYFPGMKLPNRGTLNLFLMYELGKGKVKDNIDGKTIFDQDFQNRKIVLSYSLLDNFQLFIGKSIQNCSYDLNANKDYITAYNLFLDNQLSTYLTSSQYNLLFPFGFKPVLHPDRDRKDNLFGFTFKLADIKWQNSKLYFDYFREDRDYKGIFYPLKLGLPSMPETFVDMIMGIEDTYYRFLASSDYKFFTGYFGFENKRRRTSMYDGSYDDFHDYQSYIAKLTADYKFLHASASMKKDAVGMSLSYENSQQFGMTISYRDIKSPIEDDSNYFSTIFNRNINFEEEEETLSLAITQKF